MNDQQKLLDSLKLEVSGLSNQKIDLATQIQELEFKKRVLEQTIPEIEEKVRGLSAQHMEAISKHEEKAETIRKEANAVSAEAVQRQEALKNLEAQQAKERQDLDSLSASLKSTDGQLKIAREAFNAERVKWLEDTNKKQNEIDSVINLKLKAATDAVSRNEDILKALEQAQEHLAKQKVAFETLEIKVNTDLEMLKDESAENLKTLQAIRTETLQLQEIKRPLDARKAQLEALGVKLAAKESDLQTRNVDLEIKKREFEALEKRVNKLIELHKLEAEVK